MTDDPRLWALLGASALATYAWRFAGLVLSRTVAPDGRAIRLLTAVAYATLAALISRILFLPAGTLAETSAVERLAATALAIAIFWATGRNILLGVVAGGAGLLLFVALLGAP